MLRVLLLLEISVIFIAFGRAAPESGGRPVTNEIINVVQREGSLFPAVNFPERLLTNEEEHKIRQFLLSQSATILGRTLPAASCDHIKEVDPSRSSGYYLINPNNGTGYELSAETFYCQMNESCGEGGWTRLVFINASDTSTQCPRGLRTVSSTKRVCRKSVSTGCSSATFPSRGVQYTEVCGRLTGYARSSPDAFRSSLPDGITITHGSNNRHLWSYVADHYPCGACNKPGNAVVGRHYYCDSATNSASFRRSHDYWDQHLWGTSECVPRSGAACCGDGGWFHRHVPPSRDELSVRLCVNSPFSDEEVYADLVEIYVK